jgi:hypothetical protein
MGSNRAIDTSQGASEEESGPKAAGRSQGTDGDTVCTQDGHWVGRPAARNGLWVWEDVLATVERMGANRGAEVTGHPRYHLLLVPQDYKERIFLAFYKQSLSGQRSCQGDTRHGRCHAYGSCGGPGQLSTRPRLSYRHGALNTRRLFGMDKVRLN